MKNIITSFTLIILFLNSVSQIDANKVNISPKNVIYNHLYYLQTDSYNPELAAKSFNINNLKKSKNAAIKLKQILDAKGIYIRIDAIPKNKNYIDTITGSNIYVIDSKYPQIYLEKINSKWYYSKATVNIIPTLFNKTFPFKTKLSTYFSTPFWLKTFIGLKLWQWFCLIILIVLFVVIAIITRFIVAILLRILAKTKFYKLVSSKKSFKRSIRLLSLLLSAQLIINLIPNLLLPVKFNTILIKSIEILSVFFIIFLALKLATVLFDYLDKLAQKTANTMDDQLIPVMKKIAQFIIWTIGLVYVLSNLNINITALLAGLSIGGLALALAAQDTVKNFFGSVMIFVDKPFQIGDWIHFDNVDGVVEEVGIRSTRIRTFANSLVYVPNARLADATIDNMGLRKFRRYKTELGITYDTPPEVINIFVEGIKEIIKSHPTTKKDNFEVSLNSFGSSSLNVLLYCFFEASSWTAELKGKHEIMYAIIKLAHNLNVSFAFPTQTLHIEKIPDTPLLSTKTKTDMKKALNTSIKEIKQYFEESKSTSTDNKVHPLGGE